MRARKPAVSRGASGGRVSALASLQTIVAVCARGSSSCHFGPPLVLQPNGSVEIIEPGGPPLVVPAANVASYRPERSTGGEVASPAKPPLSVGGVASPPVDSRRDKGRR